MSSTTRSRQYLHLCRRSNGDWQQALDETVILIFTKSPDAVRLSATTSDGSALYLLLGSRAERPQPHRSHTWQESVRLDARSWGAATAEVTAILRNHNITLEALPDRDATPWVRRYCTQTS